LVATPARARAAPDRRAAWSVIAPLLLATALLALLGVASADQLSAARAFVGGESLWSKSRHQASRHLREYLMQGDAASLAAFEQALAVPLGDRRARLALNAASVDLREVRSGLEQGGNDPDDVTGMVRLYRWFGRMPPIARAIEVWAAADEEILLLQALAREAQGAPTPPQRALLLDRLAAIDGRLAAYEIEFSRRLGEASRESKRWLLGLTVALALLLSVFVSVFAWRALRRIADSEASLWQSNARWRMAAEAARIGLFEWRLTTQTLDSDARCLALHGLLPEDAVDGHDERRGTPTRELFRQIHPDDRAGVIEANRVGLAGRGIWRARLRARRHDAGWRQLELIAARSPQPDAVIGLVRDVSDEELAAQLRRDKEAAEQASAAKTAFLSRASHELRTPLNAVLGFAQMMELDAAEPLSAVQRRRLSFVLQGGEHLLRLVNDILDLSRAGQGDIGVAIVPTDLGGAVRAAAGLLEPLARSHGITLEVKLPPTPLIVRADPKRLQQVLMNLLSNAVKYNRPGGRVWVEVAAAEAEEAAVTVRDDGIGMTEEQLGALFQPFNRLGAERSPVEGAGLGLVVSKSLIERFGGRLEVTSRARIGTTMRVLLPCVVIEAVVPQQQE
jgi:signal transduction histidine kinase